MVENVQPIFEKLQKTFKSGKTKYLGWRRDQLQKLITGLEEMIPEFGEALHKDLGRDKFMTELYEINGSIGTA